MVRSTPALYSRHVWCHKKMFVQHMAPSQADGHTIDQQAHHNLDSSLETRDTGLETRKYRVSSDCQVTFERYCSGCLIHLITVQFLSTSLHKQGGGKNYGARSRSSCTSDNAVVCRSMPCVCSATQGIWSRRHSNAFSSPGSRRNDI